MSKDTAHDDSFQLYDLRVEVVCPPGKRIMCGAKEGDYFTMQGEMIYLPPNQGISIYSLGKSIKYRPTRCWMFLLIGTCLMLKQQLLSRFFQRSKELRLPTTG